VTDAPLSEDEGISPPSDTDTDVTQMTLLTQTTHCRPAVPVVCKFTRDPSGLQQRHLTLLKTLPNVAFSWSSFWKLYNCWWKRQILSPLVGHIGQRTVPTA
jgi:hypothetical protein